MITTLRIMLVIASSILLSLSTAIFAGAVTSSATKSESKFEKFRLSHRGAQQAPAITNETEYAELVKKREAFNQAGSVHSALSNCASNCASSRKLLKQSH